ncbi:hypothetical protein PAPYR_12228 [Paratrimastix pyriformis]|uniref:Chromo domain-containing protein n=1 Tax=Paratrimastix pyriformis TaxID=342808 RepID=A0ABQ8U4S9_9EUKA|nr:hypothetical protein PAPYR_12228 [Paratrimastix pyriformis]
MDAGGSACSLSPVRSFHSMRLLLVFLGECVVHVAVFALNTAQSRVTRFSPFEVLHGFPARTPLSVAVGLDEEPAAPDDFASDLTLRHASILQAVQQAEESAARDTNERYKASLRSRTPTYEAGQYVLARNHSPTSKLSLPWTGPLLVLEVLPHSELLLQDLTDNSEGKVHLDTVTPFLLDPDHAAPDPAIVRREGEYRIDEVFEDYEGEDGRWWFLVKWQGFPRGVDEGVCLGDAHYDPAVKAYIKALPPLTLPTHRTLTPPPPHYTFPSR